MANAETTQILANAQEIDLSAYEQAFEIVYQGPITAIRSRCCPINMDTDSLLMADHWTQPTSYVAVVPTQHAHNVVEELYQAMSRRHDAIK